MLHVLHCIYDDPANPWVGGGGAARVRELYARLAGAVDVTVLTGNHPGAADGEVAGVRYRRLGAARPYAWSRATFGRAASRQLRLARYDVAVVELSAYTPIVLPPDRPVAIAAQMLIGPEAARRWGTLGGRAVAWAERRWLRGARHACAASRRLAGELAPLLAPDAEITVVGNGVGPVPAPPPAPAADAEELLCYGRFDVHQKGLDVLLDAMALVRRDRPATRLRIAGRGRDAARLRALVAARAPARAVVVEESPSPARVAALFAGAALLVAPSRFEGVPLAFMEAMAAGLPVLATDVGGVSELRTEGDASGIVLVPPGDAAALARAAVALLDDRARRDRMRDAARRAARDWSWDAVAERHLAFLHRVAERGGRRAP